MRGEPLDAATVGWHGLEGDRRLAFRRTSEHGAFPWLTAGKLPELLQFTPQRAEDAAEDSLPTSIRTPEGKELALFGEALDREISRRHGAPVELMQFKNGIFDDATISVISTSTIHEIGRLAGTRVDARWFRPNIVIRSTRDVPFEEDEWLGGILAFGEEVTAPAITVTMRDPRCAMVNMDPDGGPMRPEVLKAVVRASQNHAGIYATVTRVGRVSVGQEIFLRR